MSHDLLAELIDAIERHDAVALVTVTHGSGVYADRVGNRCLVWADPHRESIGDLGLTGLAEQWMPEVREALAVRQHRHLSYASPDGEVRIFVEVQARPLHLVIVGAGHIAVPLASIASLCDFQVSVLDDRPQYAAAARFPTADSVVAGPFRAELQRLRGSNSGLDEHTYVVLVTRGHQHDVECLVDLLDDPVAYIGMIGSQRRIRAVFQLLEIEQGVAQARLDRVYAPIGLDIGARTPAEIAVCIMAEIINVMRGGPAVSLSDQLRQERESRRNRVRTSSETP